MNIKLSEIAEEKDGYAVKISATIVCPRNGRDWTTVVSGQGQTRSQAIESLMTSNKLRRFMATQLRQEVTKLYPEETGSPKGKELSSESGSGSKDKCEESRQCQASDQTDTTAQTSRSKGTKKSKRAEKQQKEEKKTPSSKGDGTTQESQSSADELGF